MKKQTFNVAFRALTEKWERVRILFTSNYKLLFILGISSFLISARSFSQISLGVSTSNTTFCVGSPVDFSSLLTGGLNTGDVVLNNYFLNPFGPQFVNSSTNFNSTPLICGQNYNLQVSGILSYWGLDNCDGINDRYRDAGSYYLNNTFVNNGKL